MANAAGMFIEMVEKISEEFAWRLVEYVGNPEKLEIYNRFLTEGKRALKERRDAGILIALATSEAINILIQAFNDPDKDVQRGAAQALRKILGPEGLEKKARELLKKVSADFHLLDSIKIALKEAGICNPDAWLAYNDPNKSPYLYSTVEGKLTPKEEKLFLKSECCSANTTREYIRVQDKNTGKPITIHIINCPKLRQPTGNAMVISNHANVKKYKEEGHKWMRLN